MVTSRFGSRALSFVYRLSQKLITLDITHLMILTSETLRPPPEIARDMHVSVLPTDQVRQFSANPSNHLVAAIASRIELGNDICVAACCGNRLAAYAWYALGSIEASQNCGRTVHSGTALSFPSNCAFLYKAFTHPDFRGRGLYKHVNRHALEILSHRGIDTILATTDWSNFSALKSCYGLGFQHLGNIWRVGTPGMVAGFYPTKAKRLDIRFGSRANVVDREQLWQGRTTSGECGPMAIEQL